MDLPKKITSISDIPAPHNDLFRDYQDFNFVQANVLDDVLNTGKSIVVSAPTGSGKTVIFELAILKLAMSRDDASDFKAVYVAPIKALCSEKHSDWNRRFSTLGVTCLEVTGDSDITDYSDITAANILVTTPEKWDSITRKWRDYENIVSSIKLFMIDEVHLLNEDGRGAILEAIVSRMKTIQYSAKAFRSSASANLRFVAASATIPNIEDLADWLGTRQNVSHFKFSDDARPVKLQKHIIGINTRLAGFKFDMSLNYKLADVIRKHSSRKPTLIFCNSRKATEMAANVLLKEYSLYPLNDTQKSALIEMSKKIQETKLKDILRRGIAFHHAGLSYADRSLIEDAFRNGVVFVLLSTNTLAVGVNLPAHLVIIKSTESFIRGSIVEYSESAVLQMIGRAGRPQYDESGVAVIMTQMRNVKKYEHLMNGSSPVESHMHKHLAEHLNSEIVLQTITDLEIAMEWIRSTFLYVRAVRCPVSYGFAPNLTRDKIEKILEEMCLTQINDLEQNGLVSKDDTTRLTVRATPYGKLMAKFYISFETMKIFRRIRGNESFLEVLNLIVCCQEFSEFNLRVSEKKFLNEMNNFPIRFPIRGKIKTREDKLSCLIQAGFGNLPVKEPSLSQETYKIMRLGQRISKCLLEYIQLSKNVSNTTGTFKALLNAVIIAKCFHANLWENSEYVSKQLKKIGTVYASMLVSAGKTTFKSILDTDPRTLESILNKQPPFGNEIHDIVRTFPEYHMEITMKDESHGQVIIRQLNNCHRYEGKNAVILIGDAVNNLLFYHERVDAVLQENAVFDKSFELIDTATVNIAGYLVHESIVGVDVTCVVDLKETVSDFVSPKPKPKKRKVIQTKLNETLAKKPKVAEKSQPVSDNTKEKLDNFRFQKPSVPVACAGSEIESTNEVCSQIIQITDEEEEDLEAMINAMEIDRQELEENPFKYTETFEDIGYFENNLALLKPDEIKASENVPFSREEMDRFANELMSTFQPKEQNAFEIQQIYKPEPHIIEKKVEEDLSSISDSGMGTSDSISVASSSLHDSNRQPNLDETPKMQSFVNNANQTLSDSFFEYQESNGVLDLSFCRPPVHNETVDLSLGKRSVRTAPYPSQRKSKLAEILAINQPKIGISKFLEKEINSSNKPMQSLSTSLPHNSLFKARYSKCGTITKPSNLNKTTVEYVEADPPAPKPSTVLNADFVKACAAKRAVAAERPNRSYHYSPNVTMCEQMDVGYSFGAISTANIASTRVSVRNDTLNNSRSTFNAVDNSFWHTPTEPVAKPEPLNSSLAELKNILAQWPGVSPEHMAWLLPMFSEFISCLHKTNGPNCKIREALNMFSGKVNQPKYWNNNGNTEPNYWNNNGNTSTVSDSVTCKPSSPEFKSVFKASRNKTLYRLRLEPPQALNPSHPTPQIALNQSRLSQDEESSDEQFVVSRIINRSIMTEVMQRKFEDADNNRGFEEDCKNFLQEPKSEMNFSQLFKPLIHEEPENQNNLLSMQPVFGDHLSQSNFDFGSNLDFEDLIQNENQSMVNFDYSQFFAELYDFEPDNES